MGGVDFRTRFQGSSIVVHHVEEVVQITTRLVLHVQLNGVTHAVTRDHTSLETKDLCFLDLMELCVEPGNHRIGGVLFSLTLIPVFQSDDNRTVRGSLSGDKP